MRPECSLFFGSLATNVSKVFFPVYIFVENHTFVRWRLYSKLFGFAKAQHQ